jgi:hypothetical protein
MGDESGNYNDDNFSVKEELKDLVRKLIRYYIAFILKQ